MKYKYQLHMHSYPCSACAHSNISEMVHGLYEGGYSGGVITNHFFGGNTGIDRKLPWENFIAAYTEDYLAGKREADKLGLDLLFGIEEGVGGAMEILPYGITPEILLAHPELRGAGIKVWSEVLRNEDVLVIQAHPFRERNYIPVAGMLPEKYLDGFEVYNHCNTQKNNIEAREYADKKPGAYILTSGGDAHDPTVICCGGIETATRIQTEQELCNILKKGMYNLIED